VGLATTGALTVLIVAGSRNLSRFDAALVAYTFASLFAMFGITIDMPLATASTNAHVLNRGCRRSFSGAILQPT